MAAVRTKSEVRALVAAAGDAVLPPAEQLAKRNIQVVTEVDVSVCPETGKRLTKPGRTGLKKVSKIDNLYARELITEPEYLAALQVLGWMQQAKLSAHSALAHLGSSGGAGGVEGYTHAQLDALGRLRRLKNALGVPFMALLVYVLLSDGDLADWDGLADSTKRKRKDQRGASALDMLRLALGRLVEGA